MAYRRLRRQAHAEFPWLEPLHEAHRLTALQARMREAPLARVFAVLRDAGIEPILGKGWALARCYPSPSLRPMGDIDLYVPAALAERAQAALDATGDAPVDLHAGFGELDDRAAADLVARSECVALGDVAVRVFGASDHLRLVCLHLLRHGALRPLWLVDVAVLLETRRSDFDWDAFRAGEPWRTEAAFQALALAHAVLGASLEGVPRREGATNPRRWIAAAVLREWGQGRSPHGARRPFALERPARWPHALRLRWPNAVEATYATGAPWSGAARLLVQLEAVAKRALRQFRGRRQW